MKTGRFENCLAAVLLGLFLSGSLWSQETEKKPEPPKTETRKGSSKPVLAEATRISTDAAIKGAAQKKAKGDESDEALAEPADSAVTELHPAAQKDEKSAADSEAVETTKKSPTRNIHGSVYGAAGADGGSTRRTGGSVGASSKTGKTSVYVETNRSRDSLPTR
ncbi:MAG: hypothetical protein ACE145_00525 [Terriglobia bacterium]